MTDGYGDWASFLAIPSIVGGYELVISIADPGIE